MPSKFMNLRSIMSLNILSATIFILTANIGCKQSEAAQQNPQVSRSPANARSTPCQNNSPSFETWRQNVIDEAKAKGVSQQTIDQALPQMVFDKSIIHKDGAQAHFQQSFLEFATKRIKGRLNPGKSKQKEFANLFQQIENQYGVPPEVLLALWGLETDYRSSVGNYSIIKATTTLAYDCRRPKFFREQLIDALRIIERGDIKAEAMVGAWAGEIGGMQFTPGAYFKYAVDFDGDGRRDIVRSVPDMLASSANFLATLGWKRGEPWLQEVQVRQNTPWDQADRTIRHPRKQWAQWGVKLANGANLPADGLEAALILPMGHKGPAFLAYSNFEIFIKWNASLVNALTVGYLANRIAGAPEVQPGYAEPIMQPDQIKELQKILIKRGFLTGDADGKMGLGTRAAIKKAQQQVGLPADSYPTQELVNRLRMS